MLKVIIGTFLALTAHFGGARVPQRVDRDQD